MTVIPEHIPHLPPRERKQALEQIKQVWRDKVEAATLTIGKMRLDGEDVTRADFYERLCERTRTYCESVREINRRIKETEEEIQKSETEAA